MKFKSYLIFDYSYLMQNSSKETHRSQNKNNIDFNHLITENSNIINNNIDVLTENVQNHSVDSIPLSDSVQKNSSQELETVIECTDAIVIENNEISTLPLSSFQKPLDDVQSTFKHLSM